MASLEDYDEFGNYIGADLESEDEDEVPQTTYARPTQPEAAPLEGFDDEPMETQEETSLIQIGDFFFSNVHFSLRQILI
jgi:U5 small nuclear ribonucleoprotein component